MIWTQKTKMTIRWSILVSGLIIFFWTIRTIFLGNPPNVSSIFLMKDKTLPLPFDVSRWWDILIGPLWLIPIIFLWDLKAHNKDSRLGMLLGPVLALAVGLSQALGFGVYFSAATGFGYGLFFVIRYQRLYGLIVALRIGLDVTLIFALAFGLSTGLASILALALSIGLLYLLCIGWLGLSSSSLWTALVSWLSGNEFKSDIVCVETRANSEAQQSS